MKKFKLALQGFSLLLDISGIAVSLLSKDNFESTSLKYIIHLCQAYRVELLILLVLMISIFYLIPYTYKHLKYTDNFNRILGITIFIAAGIAAFPYLNGLTKARYYFFNNNVIESHAQYATIESGIKYVEKGEYDMALEEFKLTDKFSKATKFKNVANTFTKEIKNRVNAAAYIHDNFVVNNNNIEDRYHKLEICAKLEPNKYKYLFNEMQSKIQQAIEKYPELYDAYEKGNYKLCRELMNSYGDVWFEPIVKDKLLHDNESYIMKLLGQYLMGEDYISGLNRLSKKFFNNYESE